MAEERDQREEQVVIDEGNQDHHQVSRSSLSEVDLLRWELALYKREKQVEIREQRECLGESSASGEGTSTQEDQPQEMFRFGLNEINVLISEFDPSKRDVNLDNWVSTIENLRHIYRWNDRSVFFYATLRLGGAAKLWFTSRQGDIKSWNTLKEELLKSFPTGQDNSSVLMEIMARKKRADESIETYFYSIAALASKIHMPEFNIIKYIISGLTDRNLVNVLTASNCKTLNELLVRIKSCINCLYNKQTIQDTRYQLYVPERRPIPFHTVHCDHLGPFPKSRKRNMYLIGLVDSFTKFVIIRAVRTTSTKEVIKLFDEVTQYFGTPTRIVTDRGSSFTSKEFARFCSEHSIKHVQTAVQTPRANGQVERYFRTIKNAIATMSAEEDGRDWDKNIVDIQWALNNLKHTTTRRTPYEILMSYKPRNILKNKLVLALSDNQNSDEEENIPLSQLREEVLKRIKEKRENQAEQFNSSHKPAKCYQEGDLVLVKQEPQATGQPKKIQPRYKGPYQVKTVLPHDRYVITDANMIRISQKPYESVHAADRLKPWCQLKDLSFDEDSSDCEDQDNA